MVTILGRRLLYNADFKAEVWFNDLGDFLIWLSYLKDLAGTRLMRCAIYFALVFYDSCTARYYQI